MLSLSVNGETVPELSKPLAKKTTEANKYYKKNKIKASPGNNYFNNLLKLGLF